MISIYGDESSSAEFATYGLLAISDADLPALAIAVKRAKALLKSNGDEPLHSKVLFHSGLRGKSSFKHASIADVEKACAFVIAQVSMFKIGFYFGRVDRRTAPKKLYVPLTNSKNSSEVLLATLELELSHLQWNAYGAAATRACKTLREPPYRVVVDHNKTIIRWFNESRQAGRLVELMWMDSTLPKWPTPTLANDTDHPGLQVVDILTYYATKQFTDPRFVMPFDSIRAKTHFMLHVFEPDVCRPYVAHRVSLLSPFPKKPNPDRMGTGSAGQLHHGQVTSQRRTKAMDIKRNGTQPSGKGPAEWFTGTVRIDPLFKAPDPARVSGASVTFEPGARTAWHTHPLGQTLIVTAGSGLAQREGGPVEQIQPGDVVWFAPGEKHWHGATPTIAMTHIAIAEALDGKVVDWMEHVSDAQYRT